MLNLDLAKSKIAKNMTYFLALLQIQVAKNFKIANFYQNELRSKIQILVKNGEILVKNRNLGQKSKFGTKIEILDKNRNFG